MGQSRGWLASRNSMTPSRALCVMGELVLTTIPGCTGHAHEATGLGTRSTSTKHMRQFPAINNFLSHKMSKHCFFYFIFLFLFGWAMSLSGSERGENILMVAVSITQ